MWIVPSEFSKALEGLSRLGGAEGDGKSWLDVEPSANGAPSGRPRWTPPAGSSRSLPPAAEQPEAKIELSSIADAAPHTADAGTPSLSQATDEVPRDQQAELPPAGQQPPPQ